MKNLHIVLLIGFCLACSENKEGRKNDAKPEENKAIKKQAEQAERLFRIV
jgi:hypothetical protein